MRFPPQTHASGRVHCRAPGCLADREDATLSVRDRCASSFVFLPEVGRSYGAPIIRRTSDRSSGRLSVSASHSKSKTRGRRVSPSSTSNCSKPTWTLETGLSVLRLQVMLTREYNRPTIGLGCLALVRA